MGKLLLLAGVVVVLFIGVIGGSGGNAPASTTQAPAAIERKSFDLADVAPLIVVMGDGVELFANGCIPYQEGGVTIEGQFTDCRIDAYLDGVYVKTYRVYVQGGRMMLSEF